MLRTLTALYKTNPAQHLIQNRSALPDTDNHMNENEQERLQHHADYRCQGEFVSPRLSAKGAPYTSLGQRTRFTTKENERAEGPTYGMIAMRAALAVPLIVLGCKPTPAPPISNQSATAIQQHATYPPRPITPPPLFKLFHQTAGSFTLITTPTATDDQISAIVWQLRDAAHTRSFDKLGIPQKLVDARDPIVWFHIYRGAKCASEKYEAGKLPCGPSYHAAGDYTLGGFTDRDHDEGTLLRGEDHATELWSPDKAF